MATKDEIFKGMLMRKVAMLLHVAREYAFLMHFNYSMVVTVI